MEEQIRKEVWEIMQNIYGIRGEPESDKQLQYLQVMTKYVLAKANGGPIATQASTSAKDMMSSNFGKVTKRRGRPPGAKNKA